jgi:hypothetical protein
MRHKFFSQCAVVSFVFLCAVVAWCQQPGDEVVRGAFITTRPSGATQEPKKDTASLPNTSTPTKSTPTKHKSAKGGKATQVAHANTHPKTTSTATHETANNAGGSHGGTQFNQVGFNPGGIGVGYTLFMRDEAGAAVRVNPKREFKSGEAIRLLIESNTDGYLYIFDAENDQTPTLIFPNAKLKGGDNRISAHVPYEIPSSAETDETLQWFVFNDTPATERIYVVVSRQPLEGVPTGERLVKFCEGKDQTCAWKPAGDQWLRLKGVNRRDEIAMSRVKDDGLFQTTAEREAVSRGLGLSATAPPPTVIYMASSASADVLITTVDLIHKK